MRIILLERIEKLGQMGEVVIVKPGYARNFLLPKKKAMRATKNNIAYFENEKVQLEAHNLKCREESADMAQKMTGTYISLVRQASEMGHLYGSIRNQDISNALTSLGFTVLKSQVKVSTPIKSIGHHTVQIVLHPEVMVDIGVIIAKSQEEAHLKIEEIKQSTASTDL